jgi:hypothetical protein
MHAVMQERAKAPTRPIHFLDDDTAELYNLKDDEAEMWDLSKQMPQKAAELRRELGQWRAQTVKPEPQAAV